jgi:DNA repair exonuclease SbcCD ATPase subunit
MKIHAIELDGFWGYREHVRVDISGIPLLVAVGHNGSGKSALVVSAVLAGMYGKFPTRTVEESITTGAASGTVAVEFVVNDSTYRVIRVHQRSGAASAAVHRLVDGEWEAVTEKGVREATAKIVELLGMTYETAVMTWVAEQGQYGAFANALPAQRFKLLAGVFDLGKYGPLHKAALERLRLAKENVAKAQGRATELNDGLVDDDALPKTGAQAYTDAELSAAAAAARTAFDSASAALAAHTQQSPAAAVERATRALSAVRDARLARLTAAESALDAARAARDAAPARRDAAVAAVETRHKDAIAALHTRIAAAQSVTAHRIEDGEETLHTLDTIRASLPALRAAVETAQAEADKASAAVASSSNAATDGAAALRDAERAVAAHETAVAEAREALSTLAHAGDCYACGQHLSESLAASLREAQEHVIQTRLDARDAAVADVRAKTAALGELHDVLGAHTLRQTATQTSLEIDRRNVFEAERELAAAGRIREELERDRARSTELVAERDAEATRLGDERDAAIRAADSDLTASLDDIKAKGQAAAAEVNATRNPSDAERALETELRTAEAALAAAPEHAATEARLREERERASQEVATLDQEAGRRAEVARRQAEQGARIAAAKKALDAATEDVRIHTELVSAYSPGGIPSMVLGSVIDGLNTAINVTLAELSGGDLQVRLTTSRETTSGTQESKVTVYVDTPTGVRSYEALSGGQRFRVDLAIRMGLAATVASGTGTPIETFILDEGWGSLDEAGIRSTLEVLNRLSEQVNVLTVSHIDSVRDAFPARIEVSTNEGTSAAVVVR